MREVYEVYMATRPGEIIASRAVDGGVTTLYRRDDGGSGSIAVYRASDPLDPLRVIRQRLNFVRTLRVMFEWGVAESATP